MKHTITNSNRHRAIGAIGAALAITAMGCVDDSNSTEARTPDTTAPASTSTPASVPPIDGANAETNIARHMLLTQAEFGSGWTTVAGVRLSMDAGLVSDLPACAPYVDAVFESPARPAVSVSRSYYHPTPALMGQYVVVLADESTARAMFDAVNAPTFVAGCATSILARAAATPCCDFSVPWLPGVFRGALLDSRLPIDPATEVVMGRTSGYWLDSDGVRHGPENVLSATVRVGRAVLIIETLEVDERGETVMSQDAFEETVATMIGKAGRALGG